MDFPQIQDENLPVTIGVIHSTKNITIPSSYVPISLQENQIQIQMIGYDLGLQEAVIFHNFTDLSIPQNKPINFFLLKSL